MTSGKAALDWRPGISAVEKGWQNFMEVNRVVYDPQKVSVEQIEHWLKQADTYRQTLQSSAAE